MIRKTTIVPIYGNGERIGTLIVAKYDKPFDDEDLLLAEYAATVIGVEILHERAAKVEEEVRKKAMVQIAFQRFLIPNWKLLSIFSAN